MSRIEITTADGMSATSFGPRSGSGPWPAVIMYMDGAGIRPAMLDSGAAAVEETLLHFVPVDRIFYRNGFVRS